MEKYTPHSLRDFLRDKFSRFEQDPMKIKDYEDHFNELDKHVTSIVDTKYKRVCYFIKDETYHSYVYS